MLGTKLCQEIKNLVSTIGSKTDLFIILPTADTHITVELKGANGDI